MSRYAAQTALALATAALVSACAGGGQYKSSGPQSGYHATARGESGKKSTTTYTASGAKIGAPYQVAGVWYYPHADPSYDAVGTASWYGDPFDGRPTATGEIYNMNELTAAHTTLPLPTNVEVTNLENNRTLVLRVNDRGPFVNGRVIDVSRRAAQLLGFQQQGTARVRVRVMPDASSNTMVASAAAPAINTRAVATAMPSGDTQLLASPSASSRTRVANMAPIPDPQPARAVASMAPIPDTNPGGGFVPATDGRRGTVVAQSIPPLPSAGGYVAPAYAQQDDESTPQSGDRTLASILPPAAAAYPAQPTPAAYPVARPAPVVTRTVEAAPAAQPAPQRVAMRLVPGPAPAAILSDASQGGDGYRASSAAGQGPFGDRVQQALTERRSSLSPVYVQAGAFVDTANAEHLRTQLSRLGPTDVLTTTVGGRVFHRVRIGPMASSDDADLALAKVREMGHPGARIVSQ